MNYLSIPLLLSFRPVSFLTFQAGPQFSILMNKQKKFLENGRDAFTDGDFSMLAGAQINILRLRVYGRYGVGLTNINDIVIRINGKARPYNGVGSYNNKNHCFKNPFARITLALKLTSIYPRFNPVSLKECHMQKKK